MAQRNADTDMARPIATPYRLAIPIAHEDRDMIARAARSAGTTMTNWCRETLVANARAIVNGNDDVE